jgi:hypothetical protein
MKTIEVKVTVGNNGKLSVNSPINMPVGEYNAVLILEDQPIQNIKHSIAKAQAIFRSYVPTHRKLSEELIQERREESSHE